MKTGRSVVSAIFALFFFSLGVGVFLFAFPLFAYRSYFASGWLGLVFSGYFLGRLVLSPLAGTLADRYGSRMLLLFATWSAAAFSLSYFLVPGGYTLFAIQLWLGLSSGIVKPVLLAHLALATPLHRQGRAFGWAGTAANLVFFSWPGCWRSALPLFPDGADCRFCYRLYGSCRIALSSVFCGGKEMPHVEPYKK